VERTAAAGQAAQVYSGTALSFTDQGLTNGTAYTYTVAAQGPWGSAAANSVTATPEAVPAAPAGVQGAAGDGEVTLSWSVVGVPGPDTPVTYSVSLDGTPVASGLSTTDYTVTGLADGTSYTFTVAATDSYNQVSAASDPVGVTPLGVPAAPSGVTAVETDGQVALSWAPASASLAAPVAGYYVERDGVQIGQVAGASSSSYTDTTVGAGSTYTYSVQAYNAVSMSATTSATSITVVAAPAIPSGLVATPTNGQVALSWDADPNANNYVLYSDGNQIYSGAGTGFAYNNLANDTVYTFYVMASGPGGTSAGSATVSATPEAVPAAPGDLQVAPEDTSAQLSWDAPATKSPQQPVTYTVFVNGVTAQMGVSGTSATISGLTDGTSYTFAVTATDAYGQVSGPSDQVSATPVGTPAAPSGASATEVDGQVELSWAPASSSAAAPVVGYNIYSGSSEVGTVTGASSSSWTDTSVVPGSTYTYSVQAYNAAASSGPAVAAPITVVAAPAAPGSLAASPTAGQVALSWDSSGGATAYYLYRGSTVVYNGTATAYTDTGLTNNTQYTYYVEAEGPGGLSGPSGAVTTTPEAAPAAPTGVAVVTGVSTATVSWDAPPTQPPQQPVTYSVYGNNNLLVAGVAGTSTTIDSLASGQYTFTVTATDAYGQVSAPSAGAVAQVQTAAQQYSAAVLADSPFAFWPMDDPAGSSVMMDTSSASTNVGTYNGTYTLGTDPGPLAGTTALGLTGAGYAAYSSSLPASNAYTLEMWFELGAGCATAGAGCTLFSSGPQYLDVEVNSPNDPGGTGLEFTVGNGTSSSTADIAQTLTAGTWYMLDLTVGADGTWGGYLDGALIGSGSSVAAPYIWGAGTVQLGASNGATGVSLTGDLADVAVYNSVLGPSQVAVDWFASQAVAAASQTATTSPTTTSPAATTTSPAATTTSLAGTTAGPAATTTGPAATTTDPAATTTTTVSPAATTTN
jgi:fibronectin type 3 domain-containing protein